MTESGADAGAEGWVDVDAGPPPAAAVDEAVRRLRATALEVERLSREERPEAAKPRCELALEVAADDIVASGRPEALAALAKLTEACDQRVFPAALAVDLSALRRASKAGDYATVNYLCEKDRAIHERTRTRPGANAFAAACRTAWSRALPR